MTHLSLRFSKHAAVTPEGLRPIGRLQSLERLWIEGMVVSDAAVPHLAQLKNLKALFIHDRSEPSPEGLQKLKEALPQTQIHGSD